jgi:predicted GNAT family acetyltransferase
VSGDPVIDNVGQQRFELSEQGLLVFANYRRHDDNYVLTHVEADPALRGTGAAARLMSAIVAHARANNFKLVPRCSYAVAWMKRHPENNDLIS